MECASSLASSATGIDVEHERRQHETRLDAQIGRYVDDLPAFAGRKVVHTDDDIEITVVSTAAAGT